MTAGEVPKHEEPKRPQTADSEHKYLGAGEPSFNGDNDDMISHEDLGAVLDSYRRDQSLNAYNNNNNFGDDAMSQDYAGSEHLGSQVTDTRTGSQFTTLNGQIVTKQEAG